MSSFGNMLEQFRNARPGMTKKELADRAGVSAGYVTNLIRGEKRAPSEEVINKLVVALELDDEERAQLLRAAREATETTDADPSVTSPRKPKATQSLGGIVDISKELSYRIFEEWIYNAEESVRIQETWLAANPTLFKDALEEASKKGVIIQVLLINPHSAAARQRSVDLWLPRKVTLDAPEAELVPKMVKANLWEFKLLRNRGIAVEVKLYDALPNFATYACDDHAFVGFYTHGYQSDVALQLHIEGVDTPFGGMIKDEFEMLWNVGEAVNWEDTTLVG